jgi:hypothetical protein
MYSWCIGVLEWWSNGREMYNNTPMLHHYNTPKLLELGI